MALNYHLIDQAVGIGCFLALFQPYQYFVCVGVNRPHLINPMIPLADVCLVNALGVDPYKNGDLGFGGDFQGVVQVVSKEGLSVIELDLLAGFAGATPVRKALIRYIYQAMPDLAVHKI